MYLSILWETLHYCSISCCPSSHSFPPCQVYNQTLTHVKISAAMSTRILEHAVQILRIEDHPHQAGYCPAYCSSLHAPSLETHQRRSDSGALQRENLPHVHWLSQTQMRVSCDLIQNYQLPVDLRNSIGNFGRREFLYPSWVFRPIKIFGDPTTCRKSMVIKLDPMYASHLPNRDKIWPCVSNSLVAW